MYSALQIRNQKLPSMQTNKSQANISAKRGRPSIEQLFPGIIETTQKFIEENGFEAHRRRQKTTATCGTTMKRVRNHLLEVVPGLKEHRENIGKTKPLFLT